MNLSSIHRLPIAATLLVLSWSTSVLAAATVSIAPSGDSSYSIQGTGMDNVAGIQLDITYDAASLATPTVTQGALVSGAMLAANTSRPGFIKIAIISTNTFSGSGQIATISFASKKGSGGITSITSSMIDKSGSSLASSASNSAGDSASTGTITTPGVPFSQPSQQTPSSSTSTTAAASSAASATTPVYLGAVTVPTEQQQQRADSQPAASPAVPQQATAMSPEQTQPSGKPDADARTEETLQFVLYNGVLDRFKQYHGSKQLSAVIALFDKNVAQTIRQEPAILLSDGRSRATLTVDIPAGISSSPNFAVNGGTLVSFKQDKQMNGRWLVEVLPEAGSTKVIMTIITGAEEFEFPLTVAPPIHTALPLDERGWEKFLKEVGTAAAPLHDFNNDGVRDYIDEYIFVANHLAGKQAPGKPASSQ